MVVPAECKMTLKDLLLRLVLVYTLFLAKIRAWILALLFRQGTAFETGDSGDHFASTCPDISFLFIYLNLQYNHRNMTEQHAFFFSFTSMPSMSTVFCLWPLGAAQYTHTLLVLFTEQFHLGVQSITQGFLDSFWERGECYSFTFLSHIFQAGLGIQTPNLLVILPLLGHIHLSHVRCCFFCLQFMHCPCPSLMSFLIWM